METPDDAISIDSVDVSHDEVTADTATTPALDKARKFVEGVVEGKRPAIAAREAGTTLKAINNSDEMHAEVEKLLRNHTIKAEFRKAMAQAGLNKMFMEAVNSPDRKDRKLALDIAKQISVEEGGQSADQTNINMHFENIESVIKGVTLEVEKEDA